MKLKMITPIHYFHNSHRNSFPNEIILGENLSYFGNLMSNLVQVKSFLYVRDFKITLVRSVIYSSF